MGVCPDCGHHHLLSAAERIALLTDDGSFTHASVTVAATDALGFTDSQPYPARLARARAATGLDDAVMAGTATINGRAVAIAAMDFRFMGGSLGTAVGEMITLTAETALGRRIPFVVVTASGGARMQEGLLALLQMAKVSQAIAAVREAGLLTISVVTDPTYGGVAASFATNCDVVVAEQGARMGFAGPRVIEQTIRQKLPPGFQTAEYLLSHGFVDAVQPRHALAGWLSSLLAATGASSAAGRRRVPAGGSPIITDPALLPAANPWDVVSAARNAGRPTTLDYLGGAFTGFVELHGDRVGSDCPAIVAGFALLDGQPVAVIGHQKGHSTEELVARNFGMPMPAGYRKALRVMRLAAALRVPIATIVDTPGAYPGADAEAGGQAAAIAGSILGMFDLRTPVVAVVTGEGGSGGALALMVADRVLMLERSTYSVISPEGCSAILWGSAEAAPDAAGALRITARDLLAMGLVDGVVPEPAGGATADSRATIEAFGRAVAATVAELGGIDGAGLVAMRRQRFRDIGTATLTFGAEIPEAEAV
ncbi:MAG TPA: acetyl-CoA carboxylase carboxyltransferase subunit alpha/beta [Trebonia sp.]|nr:acetyl-CoA carboxylase carboxyltransferase subunit alpha/beta [Trebonia sp.]